MGDTNDRNAIVETRSGPVRGEHKRGAFRCKGIPYAAPPVGDRRFRPPQGIDAWTEIHDGIGRFPIAPQPLAGMEAAAGGAGNQVQSEAECLTLNVWTPAADDRKRPVMFWIHGGGFVTGAGTVPWYEGSRLTRRDVVVVTVNYRLGALGFLDVESLGGPDYRDSGNCGLLDQIAALRWVRDNIEAFGGDPDNVTIFGESAGGMSVGTLLGTPSASGLFHKAIPQSGAAANVHHKTEAEAITAQVLAELGVDDLAALQRVPADRMVDAQVKIRNDFGGGGVLPFQPVAGGDVLPVQAIEAIRAGSAAGVPVLTGTNLHEMRLFTALDPRLRQTDAERLHRLADARTGGRGPELLEAYAAAGIDGHDRQFEALTTDLIFRLPAIELLEAQAPHAPTFGYEFRFESTAFGGSLGAAHAVEIPFVFDNLDAGGASFFVGEATDAMRDLASSMADAWAGFAHSGVPNAEDLPPWPRYDVDDRATMILDLEAGIEHDPGGPARRVFHA